MLKVYPDLVDEITDILSDLGLDYEVQWEGDNALISYEDGVEVVCEPSRLLKRLRDIDSGEHLDQIWDTFADTEIDDTEYAWYNEEAC